MENNKLKPCPFCGGKANHVYFRFTETHSVWCRNCGAESYEFDTEEKPSKHGTPEQKETTMPTNEERRLVATRLRGMADSRYCDSNNALVLASSLMIVTGVDAANGADIMRCLADLIEPEERTCRNVAEQGVLFECSECGAKTVDAVGNYTQEYCAACGAKVVEK